MSRDYLAALRVDPEKEPTQATAKTAISPADSTKAATQGTAKTARRAFGSNDSSEGGRFSEIEGLPAAVAEAVRCAECGHFEPGGNPLRGTCGAGVTLVAPLAWHQRGERLAVGFGDPDLWAADARACESWLPHGLADAVHAMADRWRYSADERGCALKQATQHPAEWLRLIEADLQGRRWPGGGGWS